MPGLDHLACRMRVCSCCGTVTKVATELSTVLENMVRKFAHPEYCRTVDSFPLGLDKTCERQLFRLSKASGEQSVRRKGLEEKWNSFKLENIKVSRGEPHNCNICQVVKTNPVLKTPKCASRGKKRTLNKDHEDKENKKMKIDSICKLCEVQTGLRELIACVGYGAKSVRSFT